MSEGRLQKRFLFLSLLVHVLFWVIVIWPSDEAEEKIDYPPLVEVEIVAVPPPVDQPAQVVEQSVPIKEVVAEDAKFLSAADQKVEKESRAVKEGEFQNSPQPQVAAAPDEKTAEDQKAEEAKKEQAKKVSQNEDYLKDIEKGMETMLSTRQFQYFAYYNVIKEKIRPHWEPGIREKFKMEIRNNRSIASRLAHTTQVLLVLKPSGEVQNVEILVHSGSTNLDNAAVEAFKKAAPFPKPPPGLIESDGKVRLLWDFVLET